MLDQEALDRGCGEGFAWHDGRKLVRTSFDRRRPIRDPLGRLLSPTRLLPTDVVGSLSENLPEDGPNLIAVCEFVLDLDVESA